MNVTTLPEAIEASPEPVRTLWRREAVIWVALAIVYWLALFIGTHKPGQAVPGPAFVSDKALHAGAYFGLATILFVTRRRLGGEATWRSRLTAAAIVLAYGVLDETTQPLFHRNCELGDWLADAAGVAAAMVVDHVRHGAKG